MVVSEVNYDERWVIALVMEAVRTSETSVNIYVTTWKYIPEGSNCHTRRRENLKLHFLQFCVYVLLQF
jgi:hypothetical protein